MTERVALVMGGGAGTGRATVLALAREGARVVVADINPEGGAASLAALRDAGGEGLFLEADMAAESDIRRVVERITSEYGALHWVSNNGAMGTPNKPLTEISEAEWDRCHSVTLKGVWLCLKHQLPLIEASGGGAIVNIASVSGMRGEVYQSAYAAAKGGVLALTKSAAAEYARRGVRVNAVCPGGINTGGIEFYLREHPELRQRTLDAHAMGRLAEPGEIADAVAYLCSDRASFITGHQLVVDGGALVRSNVMQL